MRYPKSVPFIFTLLFFVLTILGCTTQAVRDISASLGFKKQSKWAYSVEEQIAAFRQANEHGGWGFTEADFQRLIETAPEWPDGWMKFRSLRIRLGEGPEGVAWTFEAHIHEAQRVHNERSYSRYPVMNGSGLWRSRELRSGRGYLRLLSGNESHHSGVEWIIFDAKANRQRASVRAVRGPRSLADELLVAVWMFPEIVWSTETPGLYAAGYELNVPEFRDKDPWAFAPTVVRCHRDDAVSVSYWPIDSQSSYLSVPELE
ncbi:hypothetical protein KJ611_03500 [Patescibacteria group bacterium]|nr:hypothetical protein [Patescibacteria group bacterium]